MNIIVTGCKGMLGQDICDVLSKKHNVIGLSHQEFDVSDPNSWNSILSYISKPDLIIHCAAYTQVDAAEIDSSNTLWETNVKSIHYLCDICLKLNIALVFPQTFLILRDQFKSHMVNSQFIEPLSKYSKSKLEAEKIIINKLPADKRMIIRLGGFFGGGPHLDKNFVGIFLKKILPNSIKAGKSQIFVGDRVWQPLWTKDIANVIDWCITNSWKEFYQYATHDFTSFSDLSREIISILGIQNIEIQEVISDAISVAAPRPQKIIMNSSEEFVSLNFVKPYKDSLKEYLATSWLNYNPYDYITLE
jgi:dTDP-4-dehydrorhamnose reductase